MITTDFTVSRETFAATRKKVLEDAEAALRPHVKDALNRVGLPSWEAPIVAEALDLFDITARAEVDAWGPVLDDLHDAFAADLAAALAKHTSRENTEAQVTKLTRWVAQMAHNAAMEAATTSDPDTSVGLEWVTMGDNDVRSAHAEAAGQTVPTGQAFEIGGEKLLYPGQPVGDPANWMNCRCVARPTMLTEAAVSRETLVAAAEEAITTTVIVALPAATDPVSAASSEEDGAHCTLLFLGESADIDGAALNVAVKEFIDRGEVGVITDKVSGSGTLGPNKADVVLVNADNLVHIRSGLLGQDFIADAYAAVEQYPTWIPHVTLGYPETPRNSDFAGEAITFDRIAVWNGGDRTEYPLGETMPEKEPIHPEDPEFTAEMATALEQALAATPEGNLPVAPEKPAPAEEVTKEPAETLRPWHGVLAPEGAPSGDRRGFAARMLTTRDLPLPLKAQFIDDEGHKGSVVVGRIDEVYRDGGLIRSAGVWDNTPEADRAYDLIEKKMWRGVSVDLDAVEGEMVEASEDGGQPSLQLTEGRVCSATLCAIPAFAEAFVRNGTWADFANEPLPSGQMVEIPDWQATTTQQDVALTASAAVATVSADYFRNPMLTEPTAVTLGENGHIYGHLAEWGTCHIGYEVCTTAPHSETDYGYFLTGQVFTDAGPVAVGQLTVGGGHADGKLGVRAAIAHYDNVAAAVADITVFEDEIGIAFSGRIRPWATERQIHELFAAGPSGDWRMVHSRGRSSMEMIAAHAVNVQGFPVKRAKFAVEHGQQVSLIAAGALAPKEQAPAVTPEFRAQMEAYAAELDRKAEAAGVFSQIRMLEFATIEGEINTLGGE